MADEDQATELGSCESIIGAGPARPTEPGRTLLRPSSSVVAPIARGVLFGLAAVLALSIGLYVILFVDFANECSESRYRSDLCATAIWWVLVELGGLALSFIVGLTQAAWGRRYRYFFRAMLVGLGLTAGVVAVGRLVSN